MNDIDPSPEINIVLKALNHSLRRDILIFLSQLYRSCSFSELLETMQLSSKASGQFSYHLNLLISANLIKKDSQNDNKYLLTKLGERATSMLDLVDSSSDQTYAQSISNAFKDLTPKEQIFLGYQGIPLAIFAFSISSIEKESIIITDIFLVLLASILFMIYILIAYKSLQSFLALFTFTNILWLIFLQKNHKYIGSIYFSNLIGGILIINIAYNGIIGLLDYFLLIIGLGLLVLALLISVDFYRKKNKI